MDISLPKGKASKDAASDDVKSGNGRGRSSKSSIASLLRASSAKRKRLNDVKKEAGKQILGKKKVKEYVPVLERKSSQVSASRPEDDTLPIAIFDTVMYESKGRDAKSECYGASPRKRFWSYKHKGEVFEFVRKNFEIPDDFDKSLRYGARSGLCHEDRVLTAYQTKLLSLKPGSKLNISDPKSWKRCYECGEFDHFARDCPSKLE